MSSIHIKFSGVDENTGAIFLQFANDETLHAIDQTTMHGFFPSQYDTHEISELLPIMAEFGHQMLSQQTEVNKDKFTQEQASAFNQLVGSTHSVPISSLTAPIPSGQEQNANTYDLDSTKNPNGQVDQMRNVVLEVLAEEGLILGKVK